MTCDNCVCHLDEMGICQHARAKLNKRLKKVEVVETHDLTDEEFEALVKEAYNRFKPTMERLK
jgi:hypothetical protein